jgi:crotonobetaine/carnitine-CoA ligase
MQVLRELGISHEQLTYPELLSRQAARNGAKTYLIFEGRHYSYRDVDRLSAAAARGLVATGIAAGEHVVLLVGNCAETLIMNFALGRMGAVACPVNTAAKGDLLVYFLSYSKATAIVVGRELLPRLCEIEAQVPGIRKVVVIDDTVGGEEGATDDGKGNGSGSGSKGGGGFDFAAATRALTDTGRTVVTYEAMQVGAQATPLPAVSPLDPQAIMFTSGTTGPSKGVIITNAQTFAHAIGRVEYLGLRADDVVYTSLPLFHGNALRTAALAAFVADATLLLSRRFSARAFWGEVRDHGVTQFNLLSSMTNILWGQPPCAADRDHRVRQCTMVPVPEFAPQFVERFGIEIVSSYSLTDFGQGTFLQPGSPPEKFRSAGLPRGGVDLAILDDGDGRLPPGGAGEICLRSADPSLSGRSYYEMPEETARANRDGWFHTGDRGYVDADGYLYFVDRKKDAIRRRGENISSWEVEQVIARHPDVAEVAVFPVSSEMSEDEVMASVVCKSGRVIEPAELIRFCESNMMYFMVPRYLEFVEDLPRTLTAKVQKQVLRESAQGRLAELWDREKAGIVLKR